VILDSSVILRAQLNEPGAARAESLLSRTDLAAPACLLIETAHVLTKLTRTRVLDARLARAAMRIIAQLSIRLVPVEQLHDTAFELSLALHAGFYDCLYLALAIEADDTLVTCDERFVRAASSGGLAARLQILSTTA
jgi:predicted nucleic acid-binding protein